MIRNEVVTDHLFLENLQGERNKVQTYLKENPSLKVLDVGGAMGSWANEFVAAYLDCNASQYLTGKTKALLFDGNISDPEGWDSILDHVAKNGKFDFAVCTQTLEDIRNPSFVCQRLPLVAKAGYIDVPSKYHELKVNERPSDQDRPKWGLKGHILGYTGHRWIMNMVDGVLEMYPKLPFIEHLEGLDFFDPENPPGHMLCFWWEGSIPWKIVNDDFIGPNPYFVYKYYREGLRRGL